MKKNYFYRMIALGLFAALSLTLLSLFTMVKISDSITEDYRYGYLLYIARSIERSLDESKSVKDVNVNHFPPPFAKEETLELIEPTQNDNRRPQLWLVDEHGLMISSSTPEFIPRSWNNLLIPKKIHGMTSNSTSLLSPKIYIVKLETNPPSYLVSQNQRPLFQGPLLWVQGIHAFITAGLAVVLSLSICFYYLRKKSLEARKVLSSLETGNLKARFEVKKFDQFGNLILDFNRMASQIERLVNRVKETESSRSHLLQELGHDLRTPLTSLATSFDTIKAHFDDLSLDDRKEIFEMVSADIRYFKDLLEKLTIIATIDDPHYKSTTEIIDLGDLLREEIKNRQTADAGRISWSFSAEESDSTPTILGDQHLITRMFRNAFDNAARYAQSFIDIQVKTLKDSIEIIVRDDGPGLTDDALKSFGKRRERRHVKERDAHDYSLGLGSVIMKTIAEAHDGTISMMNGKSGAVLKIKFGRA